MNPKLVMKNSIQSLTPIYVGITGHRDIENYDEVSNFIKTILLDIKNQYSSSPLILFTPLAEGADRVAANAVIELRDDMIGFAVVLPMNEVDYLTTFVDKASINEYKELKKKAIGCYQVPIENSVKFNKIVSREERQSFCFANMGAYIALNTQILIAVWNGEEEKNQDNCSFAESMSYSFACDSSGGRCPYNNFKNGGTYHILRMRLFGIEDDYKVKKSFLDEREFGPIYWIKTTRKSSDFSVRTDLSGPIYPNFPLDYTKSDAINSTSKYFTCKKRVVNCFDNNEQISSKNQYDHNFSSEKSIYNRILQHIDVYNEDILKQKINLKNQINKSSSDLLNFIHTNGKSDDFSSLYQNKSIIYHYGVADALSFHYQTKRKSQIYFIICIAFFALCAFNLYSGPITNNWLIVIYSVLYLVGFAYYLLNSKKLRVHERYLNYRGIAEALRVQFFWDVGGLNERVSDYYLSNQKGINEWVKIALRNIIMLNQLADDRIDEKELSQSEKTIVKKLWLLNQREYYSRKEPQKNGHNVRHKKITTLLLGFAIFIAIVLSITDLIELFKYGSLGANSPFAGLLVDNVYEEAHKWLVFVVGFLPVIIAMYTVVAELMVYDKLAKNYSWMKMVFNLAVHEYERIEMNYAKDIELNAKIKKVLFDVGIHALLENGEWFDIFNERAPKMPS